MRNKLTLGLLVILSAGAVAGCAYKGGGVENPLARKAVWFSFVGGDDIKSACAAGSPDRYRLVYNGVWREQVRIYELGLTAPRKLDQRVIGPGNLTSVTLNDPLAPWAGTPADTVLDTAQYDRLVAAFAESGMFAPPPVGLQMASDSYYWTAAACHHGKFVFTAWAYPSERFERITFDRALLELDGTKVPFNPPHPIGTVDMLDKTQAEHERERWYIKVDSDGLL